MLCHTLCYASPEDDTDEETVKPIHALLPFVHVLFFISLSSEDIHPPINIFTPISKVPY